jgi:putative ABC transport system permease protein
MRPALGRDFLPEEAQPGKETVALINHNFWRHRYAGDPNVVGQKLTLDGKSYTVIGILPPELKHPGRVMATFTLTGPDVWVPLIPAASEQNRGFANLSMIARLKPQTTLTQAQAEMNALAKRLEQQYPDVNLNLGVETATLHEHLTGRVERALWILLGAVGCVLLIACVNVANLLLARAAGRQTELAVRTALGASRWQLRRQLLTECLLLSLAGGGLGLLVAAQGAPLLTGLSASSIPRVDEVGVSLPVLAFNLLTALLASVVFGLAPALQTSDFQLVEALKESKKGAAGSLRSRRWLNGLVVAEIALALILLTGAGLMLRSFQSASAIDLGFDPHNLLVVAIPLPLASYKDQPAQLQFHERALQKLSATPGVQSAASVFRIPLFTGVATTSFSIQGRPAPEGQKPDADYRASSADYFRTVKMRLVKGRDFSERDGAQSADVVIINEELARRHFPADEPVGKRLQFGSENTRWREIVGVVADAKLASPEAKVGPAIYAPLAQNTWPNALRASSFVVRASGDPNHHHAAIRAALREIDPALPLTQMRTMEEILRESFAQRRFNTALLVVFAVVAGMLATVGVYGVMSYLVTQRAHELGVRLALGAQRADILKLVAGEGFKLAVAGIALGLLGALGLTRLLAGLLFGVSATDPLTFVSIALLLAAAALLASYLPARRAAGTDPLTALRRD